MSVRVCVCVFEGDRTRGEGGGSLRQQMRPCVGRLLCQLLRWWTVGGPYAATVRASRHPHPVFWMNAIRARNAATVHPPAPLRESVSYDVALPLRALPTETNIKNRMSQSRSGTSVNLSNSGERDNVTGGGLRMTRCVSGSVVRTRECVVGCANRPGVCGSGSEAGSYVSLNSRLESNKEENRACGSGRDRGGCRGVAETTRGALRDRKSVV